MKIEDEIARCTECEACMEVCPTYHATRELLFSPMYRLKTAGQIFSGDVPEPRLVESIYNCPKCLQCEAVCPEGAITKRPDGIVLVDQSKCIGCRYCRMVCPFGAPQYEESGGKMEKCTYCVERIDEGLRPACGSFCATKALYVGKSEADVDSEASKIGASKLASVTNPDAYVKGSM